MAARKVLQAKANFTCEVAGEPLLVRKGERVAASHPAVKGRESLFEAVEPRPDIEVSKPSRKAK